MVDPRTPVIVGVGRADQHADDPDQLVEALELMVLATDAALADADAPTLAEAVELVSVPDGTWGYRDAGRLVADRLGAPDATTLVAEIGIVQQDLLTDAWARITRGELDVALVVGGEARHRSVRARVTGTTVRDTIQDDDVAPDIRLAPESLGINDLEITRNAVTPTTSYALMEHARMHALGRTVPEHRRALGQLWEGFAAVAAGNPHAWDRSGPGATDIVTPTADNRMIATPYTKVMCSQWNVDQAAALILCSVDAARRFGVPEDRWVFLHGATVSNHTVPVIERAELQRSAGAEVGAVRVLELAGIDVTDLTFVDLYSCFPAAVQALAEALGLAVDGTARLPLTVTGGMGFGGGPLNNYVLQALATLVPLLRSEPGSYGLSSSVSGFLNKQAFSVWSTAAPSGSSEVVEDVSAPAAAIDERLPVDAAFVGAATIASWTVAHERGEPFRAVVIADVAAQGGPARTLASTGDAEVIAAMLEGDWIGCPVAIRPDGSFVLA